jgi:hypothetical protein
MKRKEHSCVVLISKGTITSILHTEVYGPFKTTDAAYEWIDRIRHKIDAHNQNPFYDGCAGYTIKEINKI